jgi:hypothetical protein
MIASSVPNQAKTSSWILLLIDGEGIGQIQGRPAARPRAQSERHFKLKWADAAN